MSSVRLISGDCRAIMATEGPFDLIIADPPYGDTSLSWDRIDTSWVDIAADRLKPTGSMWVFGSMRHFLATAEVWRKRFRLAQDVVWEKHNGSGLHSDRFRRVHENVVQFYLCGVVWADVYNEVQMERDAVQRTVKRKKGRPAHMGNTEAAPYASVDGGPRIMRSVIEIPNCHGHAIHPTEKPVDLMQLLVKTSCPPGGLVGDFFAGSGSCAEACSNLGRDYVGCEIDDVMATRARNRSLFVSVLAQAS